jgi:hypothetical protein
MVWGRCGVMRSLPCGSRGGLGWGWLGFSAQLNIAMSFDRMTHPAIYALGRHAAFAARFARTPP